MATKLKNIKLTSVDLVRAGANQEADICLFKSAEPPGATESPTDEEKNIFKRFIAWMRQNPTEAENEPHSHIEKGEDIPDLEYIYKSALAESLHSIMQDETLTEIEKKDMSEESLRQYAEKIQELERAEEDYDGGDDIDEEAIEEVDDFDKDDDLDDDDDDTIEEEIIEEVAERRPGGLLKKRKRRPGALWDVEEVDEEMDTEHYDIDEIEEVDITKYNHNHGADGKFSSSPGAGGGGSSSSGSGSGSGSSASDSYKTGSKKGNVSYGEAEKFGAGAPEGTKITMSRHNTGDYVGEYEKKNGEWVGSQQYKSSHVKPPNVKTPKGFAMQVVGNDIKVISGSKGSSFN